MRNLSFRERYLSLRKDLRNLLKFRQVLFLFFITRQLTVYTLTDFVDNLNACHATRMGDV